MSGLRLRWKPLQRAPEPIELFGNLVMGNLETQGSIGWAAKV